MKKVLEMEGGERQTSRKRKREKEREIEIEGGGGREREVLEESVRDVV